MGVISECVAFWIPALRSNACALQRVRDTQGSASHVPHRYRVSSVLTCP